MITSNSDFATTVRNIADHYKGNPTRRYPLTATEARSASTLPEVQDLLNRSKTEMNQYSDGVKGDINQSTEQLKQDNNQQSFRDKINARAEKAKKDNGALIDKWADETIKIGEAHPDQQNALLTIFDSVNNFFGGVLKAITGFIGKIVQSIVDWIVNAAKEVGAFFGGLANDIGNFFGSIFGRAALATSTVRLLPDA